MGVPSVSAWLDCRTLSSWWMRASMVSMLSSLWEVSLSSIMDGFHNQILSITFWGPFASILVFGIFFFAERSKQIKNSHDTRFLSHLTTLAVRLTGVCSLPPPCLFCVCKTWVFIVKFWAVVRVVVIKVLNQISSLISSNQAITLLSTNWYMKTIH